MLEQMPDSVIYADTEGKIRFWNAASEQMFGFTAQEAIGQSLDIIIPEYLREPHWRGFYAAVESGNRRVQQFVRQQVHQTVPLPPEWAALCNFNTPEEFERAVQAASDHAEKQPAL